MKSVTWQQILAMAVLVVGPVLVHKFIGSDEGQMANVASILLAWVTSPPGAPAVNEGGAK